MPMTKTEICLPQAKKQRPTIPQTIGEKAGRKIGKRKNCSYLGFMRYARRYLAWDEFIEFVSSVVKKVDEYSGESEVLSHVLRQMGFADLEESFFDR